MLKRLVVTTFAGGIIALSASSFADGRDPFPRDNSRDRSVDAPVIMVNADTNHPFPTHYSGGRSDRSVASPAQLAMGSTDSPFPRDNSRDRSVDGPFQVAMPETASPFPKDNSIDRLVYQAG